MEKKTEGLDFMANKWCNYLEPRGWEVAKLEFRPNAYIGEHGGF